MFALSDNAALIMLQWIGNVGTPTRPTTFFAALHSGVPGQNGASNELSGNGYARTSFTPTVSSRTLSNTGAITFPAVTTANWAEVLFASVWDASSAGNCILTGPLASALARPFDLVNTTTDLILMPGHGFANTDRLFLQQHPNGAAVPAGLTKNTVYYVINANTDDFQLSATSGGAAVAITAVGAGTLQKITNARTALVGDQIQFAAGVLSFQLPAAG